HAHHAVVGRPPGVLGGDALHAELLPVVAPVTGRRAVRIRARRWIDVDQGLLADVQDRGVRRVAGRTPDRQRHVLAVVADGVAADAVPLADVVVHRGRRALVGRGALRPAVVGPRHRRRRRPVGEVIAVDGGAAVLILVEQDVVGRRGGRVLLRRLGRIGNGRPV